MIRKSLRLILLGTLSLSPVVVGGTLDRALLSKVEQHPAVVEAKNQALLKGLRIREMVAEDGLQINLSTKSKLSLMDRFSDNQYRITDQDRSYIDGVVTAQKTIYDFGASGFSISSERHREKAAQLEYLEVYEQTMQTLLSLAVDVTRINRLISSLDQTIATANTSIDELELRFTSGVGTVVDVRRAQLLLLDLETERDNLYREKSIKVSALKTEFNVISTDMGLINSTLEQLIPNNTADGGAEPIFNHQDVNSTRSLERINQEKVAIRYEMQSLRAAEYPQLNGTLTGVLYDVTRGVDEYELYGGVNVSMSLFDSGLSSSKEQSLRHQLQLQDDALLMLENRKRLDALELTKRYQQLFLQYRSSREKAENLRERLSQITRKIAMTGEGLLSRLQATIELAEAERIISAYPQALRSLTIDHLVLNEQLLDSMSATPATQ